MSIFFINLSPIAFTFKFKSHASYIIYINIGVSIVLSKFKNMFLNSKKFNEIIFVKVFKIL